MVDDDELEILREDDIVILKKDDKIDFEYNCDFITSIELFVLQVKRNTVQCTQHGPAKNDYDVIHLIVQVNTATQCNYVNN